MYITVYICYILYITVVYCILCTVYYGTDTLGLYRIQELVTLNILHW